MAPTSGNTHTKRALFELRQRIISGELAGGTRLYEVALAEDLEISRTPVREAMSRLAEEGLLERVSAGGFMVRSFSVADVSDAIEIRGVLEGAAARLAAERGVTTELMKPIRAVVTNLDACVGKRPEDVRFDEYSELNAVFHDELAILSRSDLLIRELTRAKSLPFASPSAFVPDETEIDSFRLSLVIAQNQHRMIVDAIINREGARAENLVREHARIARGNLDYALNEDTDLIGKLPGLAIMT